MSYWLRDKNGVGKSLISNDVVQRIMKNCAGHFEEITFIEDEKKVKKACYIFDDDFANEINRGIKLFFWKGDKLVPEKK